MFCSIAPTYKLSIISQLWSTLGCSAAMDQAHQPRERQGPTHSLARSSHDSHIRADKVLYSSKVPRSTTCIMVKCFIGMLKTSYIVAFVICLWWVLTTVHKTAGLTATNCLEHKSCPKTKRTGLTISLQLFGLCHLRNGDLVKETEWG